MPTRSGNTQSAWLMPVLSAAPLPRLTAWRRICTRGNCAAWSKMARNSGPLPSSTRRMAGRPRAERSRTRSTRLGEGRYAGIRTTCWPGCSSCMAAAYRLGRDYFCSAVSSRACARAMARRAAPGSTPRAGFNPSSWARCSAARARCTSISSARSATSASTRTWSSNTSTKPPWMERYRFLPSDTYVRVPMPSNPSSGAWPGRIPMYPSLPGTCTSLTCSRTNSRSGVATSRESVSAMGLRLLQFRRFLEDFLDGSLHVECLLGQAVVLAFDNFAEALDGIGELDVLALVAGELLGDVERLGEELLDLAGARHNQLVLVGEFVDTQNGDDVLEILVALQGALDHLGHLVVVLADDEGIQNARGGSQRVDGGVNAQRGDIAREVGGGVEVGEGGGGGGVGVIVGGHVDGLHGGDRALVGGGDALLQFAHFGGQVGLVSDGARHAADQRDELAPPHA